MAVAVAIVAACGGVGDLSDSRTPSVAPVAPSVAGYRVLGPGPFIAGFPEDPLDMEADLVIERMKDAADPGRRLVVEGGGQGRGECSAVDAAAGEGDLLPGLCHTIAVG